MIRVKIEYKDKNILSLKVTGHADYDEHGKDLVCAGVSSILVGGINAIDEANLIDMIQFKCKEGFVEIQLNSSCDELQIMMKMMFVQLKTIQETYCNYISIQEV